MSLRSAGRLELICGPMFSGKTTTLIGRLLAARDAGLPAKAIKPSLDTRYGTNRLVSHDGRSFEAANVEHPDAFRSVADGARVFGIDEVHFFDGSLVVACGRLVAAGVRVIAAGVYLDHRGRPFEVVERLAAVADDVTRLVARCARCGGDAIHSQRLVRGDARIVVGGVGAYEPRCERCFEPPIIATEVSR